MQLGSGTAGIGSTNRIGALRAEARGPFVARAVQGAQEKSLGGPDFAWLIEGGFQLTLQ
jgi:hypothetical protein